MNRGGGGKRGREERWKRGRGEKDWERIVAEKGSVINRLMMR